MKALQFSSLISNSISIYFFFAETQVSAFISASVSDTAYCLSRFTIRNVTFRFLLRFHFPGKKKTRFATYKLDNSNPS